MASEKTYTVRIKATGEVVKAFEWANGYALVNNHDQEYRKDELEIIKEE